MSQIKPDHSTTTGGAAMAIQTRTSTATAGAWPAIKCRILKCHYIDDPDNTTRNSDHPQLEYTVCALDGSGQTMTGVIDSACQGGVNNNTEVVRHATSDYNEETDFQKDYRESDGEIVLVQNMNGIDTPVIVGGYKHPKVTSAATRSRGEVCVTEVNGVRTEIDADGGCKTTNLGGPIIDSNGTRKNPSAAGSSTGVDKDGNIFMTRVDAATGETQGMTVGADQTIAVKGPGGTEMNFKAGGVSEMKSTAMQIASKQSLDLKSAITNMGPKGLPSIRIGDFSRGIDSNGFTVISSMCTAQSALFTLGA